MGNEAEYGLTEGGQELLPAAAGTATTEQAAVPAGNAAEEAAASAFEANAFCQAGAVGFEDDGSQFFDNFGANLDPAALACDDTGGTSDGGSSTSGSPAKTHPTTDPLL